MSCGKNNTVTLSAEELAARVAGLRHVSDGGPGISRRRSGKGFRYIHATGVPVREEAHLQRIRALAIPPAWSQVWICPHEVGHIQATGRDAKGRKQYRYHASWRETRDQNKYHRLEAFGAALPKIRERAAKDVARPGLPREKVIATVVELLDLTWIRIGNEEYARNNASFGLTTLRDRHVRIHGAHLEFHFRGKSGKEHRIGVEDRRLAAIVKRCQELPGQELFHFKDATGALHSIESADVNSYLRRAAGDDFTAKDFRAWHGTLLAARLLASLHAEGPPTKTRVVWAVREVAARLGNTPTVCRKSYVHPAILTSYLRGGLARALGGAGTAEAKELALLKFLKREHAA